MELISDIHMLDISSRLDQCSLLRYNKGGEQGNRLAQQAIGYLHKSFKKNKYNSDAAMKDLNQALKNPTHSSKCVTIHGMYVYGVKEYHKNHSK